MLETARAGKEMHLLVIHKRIHQQPLLYEFLPFWFFVLKVPIIVVGHDDAIGVVGQLHNKAVVIADHPPPLNSPRRSENKNLLLLQFV